MRKLLIASAALAASVGVAIAGGAFNGFPIVGDPGNDVCLSYGNNNVCNQYSPAGPNGITGVESIPADTNNASGTNPQTVLIPSALVGGFNNRVNRLIGGDFNTNLWQRGTTPLSSATPSTPVMGPDRWAVYSSTNTVSVIKETGTTDTIPSLGFYASARVSRPSTTTTTQICIGQTLDKQAASELLGNNVVFSFYGLAGAGLAAVDSNNAVTVTIAYYTAADSSTPFTNTSTFMQGTTTGYTAVVGGASPGTTLASLSSGVATVNLSTTWTRYAVWGKIPTANSSGTAVTGAGVTICYTPTSGTGGSTEWFEFTGAQLQAQSSAVTNASPNGIIVPTGFERRTAQQEADYQLYYTQGLGAEVNGMFYMAGGCQASGNSNYYYPFSTPMRVAPTAATSTLTAGGYSIKTAAAVTAIGTITIPAASTQGLTINSAAACTSTLPYQIVGTNTTGLILFSAEP
jgi:hypothetical protein